MASTRKEFAAALEELRRLLVNMGERTEDALIEAIQALSHQEVGRAKKIIERDQEINNAESKIVDLGSKLVATQQPVAKDFRRILVAFKISSDLERMADLAVDIAKVVVRLEGQPLIKPLVDIPRMADVTKSMIHHAIQSYVSENLDLAYRMAKDDDQVDHLYSQILRELFTYMSSHPQDINQAMLLSFVARYIERIADHATNIGELVVYLVEGRRPELNI